MLSVKEKKRFNFSSDNQLPFSLTKLKQSLQKLNDSATGLDEVHDQLCAKRWLALMWSLESQDLLMEIQCGFKRNRSTLDHLVCFETFIRDAFVQKQHVLDIFFDLKKAYDTTWKQHSF